MGGRRFVVLLLCTACLGLAAVVPGSVAAAATGSVSVSPSTGLTGGQEVTVTGSGFSPSVDMAICEGIVDGTAGPEDCGIAAALFQSRDDGSFSVTFSVARFMSVGSRSIDCAAPGAECMVGAAELSDIVGTAVVAPISFAPASGSPRPDMVFKRRDTQQLLENDQYFGNISFAPQHNHAIASGGKWVYALVVQNDGDVIDDLVLTSPIVPPAPLSVRVFVGYSEITSDVTGSGYVFHGVLPGQSITVGVQFSAAPGAHDVGALASIRVRSSVAPELVDFARLWVDAPTTG